MGSAALWQLASRGASAIGFERHQPGHDQGSSHGDTRIIRTAYFEGPEYVPLAQAAFGMWRTLERESGAELLRVTGGLTIGRPGSPLVRGVLASVGAHGLQHRVLDGAQAGREFPQHVLDGDDIAVFESEAGFVRPEAAVRAAAERAGALGATVMPDTEVARIDAGANSVRVSTSRGDFDFSKLIVSAGAWTAGLLPDLRLPLVVERNVMTWFQPDEPDGYAPEHFPVFLRDIAGGPLVYGFPTTDGITMKLAIHHGGRPADPETLDREVHDADVAPVREYVRQRLRGVSGGPTSACVCMYTNTPDQHFLIGIPPRMPRVVVVSACSGHGFKFAPVIGRLAAELALGETPSFDISTFGLARFA
jgi:sarcosine oxidase